MICFEGPHYLTGDLFRDADQEQLNLFQRDQAALQAELDRFDAQSSLSITSLITLCSMRSVLGHMKLETNTKLVKAYLAIDAFYREWRLAMISIEHGVSKYSGNCHYSGRSPDQMFLEEKERYRIMREWFGEDC